MMRSASLGRFSTPRSFSVSGLPNEKVGAARGPSADFAPAYLIESANYLPVSFLPANFFPDKAYAATPKLAAPQTDQFCCSGGSCYRENEGFEIEFSDEGILLRAPDVASRMSWSFYSRVVETERVYVLIRGTMQMTVIPKKSFTSAAQEASFRRLLARRLPPEGIRKLKGAGKAEIEEYVPPSAPPDWR